MLSRAGSEFHLLGELKSDHRSLSGKHEEIEQLGRWWLADGFLQSQETTRLVMILADLRETYTHHIATEEKKIFPFAERILTVEDLESIANEMAARRGIVGQQASQLVG